MPPQWPERKDTQKLWHCPACSEHRSHARTADACRKSTM